MCPIVVWQMLVFCVLLRKEERTLPLRRFKTFWDMSEKILLTSLSLVEDILLCRNGRNQFLVLPEQAN